MSLPTCHVILFRYESHWIVGYVDQGQEIVPFDGSFTYIKMDELEDSPIDMGAITSFSSVNDVVFQLRQKYPEIEPHVKIDFLPFVKAQKKCKHITDRKIRNNTIEDPWDMG